MTQMRRLDASKKGDLFERASTSLVRSFEMSREEFDHLRQNRPDLIASTTGNRGPFASIWTRLALLRVR